MSAHDGICPHCETSGHVGDRCDQELCQRKRYHVIPADSFRRLTEHPYDDRDPLIGHVIDSYLIAEAIGEGGFGKVYLAMQLPVLMKSALKIMLTRHTDEQTTDAIISRFKGEALSLAKLGHPNIVRLLATGSYHDRPYLIMEFVDGARTLETEWLEHQGLDDGFRLRDLRHVMNQVLNALESAHQQQVIHRDLKPENIMLQQVTGDPYFVRILDFGLAKILDRDTKTSIMAGTPVYMAPEQLQGHNMGPWTDVYAVGVLLYELCTLRTPFLGDSVDVILAQKLDPDRSPLVQPHVTNLIAPFREICERTFAPDPAQRFQTATQCRDAINTLFDQLAARGIERVTYKTLLTQPAESPPATPEVAGDPAARVTPLISAYHLPVSTISNRGGRVWWQYPALWATASLALFAALLLLWPGRWHISALPTTADGEVSVPHQQKPAKTNHRVIRPDGTSPGIPPGPSSRRDATQVTKQPDRSRAPRPTRPLTATSRFKPLRMTQRFSKLYGGKNSDEAFSLITSGNDAVIVVGASLSRGNGIADLWTLKLTLEGDGIWEAALGGNGVDVGLDLARTKDGGTIVVGHTASKGKGQSDAWVIKLNSQGQKQWEKTLGGQFKDQGRRVSIAPDGTILLAGTTRSKGAGQNDGWLVKLDAGGRLLWEHTYGTGGNQGISDLSIHKDGTVVLVGHTESPETGLDDVWVLALSSLGKTLWERRIGDPGRIERAASVARTPDGDLLIAGLRQRNIDTAVTDVWVVRLSKSGDLRWSQTFSSRNSSAAHQIVSYGKNYLLVANSTANHTTSTQAWIFVISERGAPLWEKLLRCSGSCQLRRAVVLANGDLVLAGYKQKPKKPKKLWVLRATPNVPK